jgi:ABC-2 type transport system ATP-binding protein
VIESFFTGLFSTIRVSNSLNSSLQSLPGDAAEDPVLSIRGAVKTLGSWRALDGVDLDLFAGEILVLLGPNGAGKSTLLGGACGRLPLDAGEVSLFGRSPRRDASVRSKLGFVPQHLAVYPYLSVRENLEIIGRMMGVSRRDLEQRVQEAMTWAGLTERAGDTTETLSGGMRRRLNIVASLMHHPAVVLLDEPTVGVDMDARERVHEMLRRLRTSGLGMLLTTHDLSQAEDLADRVAFMVDGKVVLVGRPADLIQEEFRDMKELKITLRQKPDTAGSTLLQGLDLRPAKGHITWTGPVDGDLAHVGELTTRLEQAGLATAEVRVREPGLEGVLLRLTGEELRP